MNDWTPAASWPPAHPLRQYTNTYLAGGNYPHLLNRLSTSSVSGWVNGVSQPAITLTTNYYDGAAVCSGYSGTLASVTGSREHDDANFPASFLYRGNLMVAQRINGTSCAQYDALGNSGLQQDTLGRNISTSFSNNYAAPAAISTGSYSDTMSWSSFLGIQTQNNTGASSSVQYDSDARPSNRRGCTGR